MLRVLPCWPTTAAQRCYPAGRSWSAMNWRTGASSSCTTWRRVPLSIELDPATDLYALTGIFHERLESNVPFPVDIALDALTR